MEKDLKGNSHCLIEISYYPCICVEGNQDMIHTEIIWVTSPLLVLEVYKPQVSSARPHL